MTLCVWRGTRSVTRLLGHDDALEEFGATQYGKIRRTANRFVGKSPMEPVHAMERPAIKRDNEVAFAKPGQSRGRPGFHLQNKDGRFVLQTVMPRNSTMHTRVLASQPEVATTNAPILDEPGGDPFRSIDGDGEADALRGKDDRGVDSDDLALGIHQRTAGVPGVQGGIGLNDGIDEAPRLRADGAAEGADDSSRDGAVKPVRIPDRDHQLSHSQWSGISQHGGLEVGCIDSQDGQIRVRIFTDQMDIGLSSIGQGHSQPRCVPNHVAVGQDEAVLSKDEAGSASVSRRATLLFMLRLDPDDTGTYPVGCTGDRAGIRVQEQAIVAGRLRECR